MADIRVTWDPIAMSGDWALGADGDLDGTRELVSAVAVSLFTDRLAEPEDVLWDGTTDRRGWWGDMDAADLYGGTPIGSRLWLLHREKQTEDTRQRAEDYIREALAWLIDNQIAVSVDMTVAWFAVGRLGADVVVVRGPRDSVAVRFERLWDELDPS